MLFFKILICCFVLIFVLIITLVISLKWLSLSDFSFSFDLDLDEEPEPDPPKEELVSKKAVETLSSQLFLKNNKKEMIIRQKSKKMLKRIIN